MPRSSYNMVLGELELRGPLANRLRRRGDTITIDGTNDRRQKFPIRLLAAYYSLCLVHTFPNPEQLHVCKDFAHALYRLASDATLTGEAFHALRTSRNAVEAVDISTPPFSTKLLDLGSRCWPEEARFRERDARGKWMDGWGTLPSPWHVTVIPAGVWKGLNTSPSWTLSTW
ncbi:hypothetical protein GLOTRDRAFT_134093 [Gloeophyllum trabeum ATCC 11539]|uniref:Uncharacterized protein n=1 Tax=Gloeophyllum trabeum (strain ATCC 11539 / FP-39264 / Madison 617) TaxID=670483 RepID=S7RCY7_GLOTA|nr:uncharacterized protein GLOTRDRAFT_134093 [Gloeophyllum trabeum ATCC 11539]EPQ50284.1 hypothetical protein GLOTRDRAFT_134093 [Gloeophyllum trabeum ATCC 11539]